MACFTHTEEDVESKRVCVPVLLSVLNKKFNIHISVAGQFFSQLLP